jgi:hypothetical protein
MLRAFLAVHVVCKYGRHTPNAAGKAHMVRESGFLRQNRSFFSSKKPLKDVTYMDAEVKPAREAVHMPIPGVPCEDHAKIGRQMRLVSRNDHLYPFLSGTSPM